MPNRRHFLQLAGASVAAVFSVRHGLAADDAQAETAQPAARKEPLSLGIASYSFRKFPCEKVWSMAKRVGVKHICLHPQYHLLMKDPLEKVAQVAAETRKQGLDLYGGGVVTMSSLVDVDRAFEWAKAAGLRLIMASPDPAHLSRVNEKVQEYGIKFAIHNHGPTDDRFPTPQSAYEKIKNLDPRIGLCIDVGHTMRAGVEPSKAAEECADRVMDVHMKDVSASVGTGREVPMGRGIIDVPRFVRTLKKIGYQGIVSFEYELDPDDPLVGLSQSVGYLRGVMATV